MLLSFSSVWDKPLICPVSPQMKMQELNSMSVVMVLLLDRLNVLRSNMAEPSVWYRKYG